ncbi:MAG: alpha/beta hydrolase, partial [Cyanobacteria bacterium J06642_11]
MLPRLPSFLAFGIFLALVPSGVSYAADEIIFKKGIFTRSLQIESLEEFATVGSIPEDLEFLFTAVNVNDRQQSIYRQWLQTSAPITPNQGVLLSRFLNTPMGEELLEEVGSIIQTESGLNGARSIRAGLTLAALDQSGPSLLSFLRYLGTDVQIDLDKAQSASQIATNIIQTQIESIQLLNSLAKETAAKEPEQNYMDLPELSKTGPYRFQKRRLSLTDKSRNRELYVDVYRPTQWQRTQAPVVIISHGLGDNPERAAKYFKAEHLASHGYVVVIPQHPKSDAAHMADFQRGLEQDLFLTTDFIERPQDISYVIDELERRNLSEFQGQLNLETIGISGHSLGGYTALAVAGARIDFDRLETECRRPFVAFNASLLLQCQAQQLPRLDYDLKDERVAAIKLLNPVNSAIFGPDGLGQVDVPVFIVAGSHDPATPAVFEQFQTFSWFTTPDRFLALLEGQAHIDTLELDWGLSKLVDAIPNLTLASSDLTNSYMGAMGLAYFERYIGNKMAYDRYLRSSYAEYLSKEQPFKLHLISADAASDLIEPLEDEPQFFS